MIEVEQLGIEAPDQTLTYIRQLATSYEKIYPHIKKVEVSLSIAEIADDYNSKQASVTIYEKGSPQTARSIQENHELAVEECLKMLLDCQ